MDGFESIYTLEEVADYLRLSRGTVRSWVRSGFLKGTKVGIQWRIRERDLQAFMERGERIMEADPARGGRRRTAGGDSNN